ncbi:MAG: chromosome segregation protein SMC [Candidatus Omnitrophica bacterium CG11_big_fil_rev_8_21_14_0_20_45_26]|uniref:Chromosome partition protein Smc n=1 Tax=Candidatus Abzuiibacterium crystallinum TaxID=1974748 RepID=A0A2H0LSD9_9BACT|nr:MAG: chromosome segregation protein SMC [Candidatus Omnitrophica bacterium CG11_big_fil_rev_8_21_14_0_20_45_26]PIW65035.1 MAG: chromosome segregation protein SMC [Candidatus Omnitrophica bacterium CG12_big_fil_rev_8_21_14_0_65_45_16]
MHLKKIELAGFKSFAKKTELLFEKGVTCIVGPNGCGKSNISDAIRWVLGERSAKMLRGSKMEDVIFQGTDFRDPVHFAEVTLTIDNSDHALPIDYTEVSLTRRLHRSGESEYLINRTACRLKDIQNLILDTGIGSSSYSMIEQGRIDYILNAEAEERRFLIEEAAGISKYKVKKEEAIRKLDHTENNLLRLNDIIAEVERNIKYAERQAKRAEQYKVNYEELKTLELKLLANEINDLNLKKGNLDLLRQEEEAKLQKDKNLLAELETTFKQLSEELRVAEKEFFETEHNRLQIGEKLSSIQKERETTRERFHEVKSQINRNTEEFEKNHKKLEQLIVELEQIKAEYDKLSSIHHELETQYQSAHANLAQTTDEIAKKELAFKQLSEDSFDHARQMAEVKNEIQRIASHVLHLNERRQQTKEYRTRLENQLNELIGDERKIVDQIASLKQHLLDQKTLLSSATLKRELLQTQVGQLKDQVGQQKEEKAEFLHQLELMSQLHGPAFSQVKQLLHTSETQTTVHAFLDLLEISDGYEVATAAALSDFSKSLITENTKDAVSLISKLRSKGHHRASILIKNQVEYTFSEQNAHQISPLQEARLLDRIKVKSGYEVMFEELLGDVYVIDEFHEDKSEAYSELSKTVRLVSKNGIFLGSKFQLTLRNGSLTPLKDLKAQEVEVAQIEEKLAHLEQTMSGLSAELQDNEKTLAETEQLIQTTNQRYVELQLHIERCETTKNNIHEQLKKHQQELELRSHDQAALGDDEAECHKRIEAHQTNLTGLEAKEREFKTQLKALTEAIEAVQVIKEQKQIQHAKAQIKLETHCETEQRIKSQQDLLTKNHEDLVHRNESLEKEQHALEERLIRLEQLTMDLSANQQALQADLITVTAQVQRCSQKRGESAQRSQEIETKRDEQQIIVQQEQNDLYQQEKREIELEYHKKSAIERVRNTYHIQADEQLLQGYYDPALDLETSTQRLEVLKGKVEQFGAVNLMAIEEYDELKKRFDFLTTQKKDLEDSRDALLEAIRKINRTTKELFQETLTMVRENFNTYFKILFQGGHADLVLIDETNPLESGLDIVARPPGKKPQHITLLSGGEKALTAIALLFALFKIKASPFCVLDEIDAPLDEANTERFNRVLREFINSTQFIIVTHSRKTISMGDSLYGVTMEEAGISKIVSVKVGQDSETIEHQDEKVQKQLNEALQ